MVTEHQPRPDRIVNLEEPLSRIVIVDDHTFLAQSLAAILRDEGHDAWVAAGTTPDAIVGEVGEAAPCLVLLDLALSPSIGSGLELLPRLLHGGSRVVMITGCTSPSELAECFEQGAEGIIDKALPMEGVLDLVERALAGLPLNENRRLNLLAQLRSARIREEALQAPFRDLTDKERAVLGLLDAGLTAKGIADELFISMSTVRSHIRSILIKLGVHSQLAAVARARDVGWIN
ncbi:MAG: response regulator transcription factor [Acidimicrobiia bacterium]|nr:response regulator transcription factor [Acidimicrobiia bacterium]